MISTAYPETLSEDSLEYFRSDQNHSQQKRLYLLYRRIHLLHPTLAYFRHFKIGGEYTPYMLMGVVGAF